jgi:hypothetical protein
LYTCLTKQLCGSVSFGFNKLHGDPK